MKICIIEDDVNLLANLRLLLGGERGFEIVGTYTTGEAALDDAPWADCEVLLVDIDLPGLSGVELTRKLHRTYPQLLILVHTISESRGNVFAALKAGALGYLLKASSPRELIESLHNLYAGGAPMSPSIARKVILDMQIQQTDPPATGLTERETEILNAISRGKTYKTIAGTFYISPHTVHSHVKRIYEKLQADNREEALKKARAMRAIW